MSSVSNTGGQPNRRPAVLVLAIIGVLAIILGIVYLAVPAGNLPSIFGHTTPANGHHVVRMSAAFVLGIACLMAAWIVNRRSKSSTATSASAPAEAATPTRD